MLDYDDTIAKLTGLTGAGKKVSGGYMFHCPCHDDPNHSLAVKPATKHVGKALIKCFAGCKYTDIVVAIENNVSVNYSAKRYDSADDTPRQVVARYIYHDENKKPLYRKVRYYPKSFSIQSFVDNRWCTGLRYAPVLYRLPDVIKAKTVFILEGEKAVDALRQWGLIATCSFDGASKDISEKPKWLPAQYNHYLAGKNIVLLPDNDVPGQTHMEYIYSTLLNSNKRIVQLPGLTSKADFYDWQAIGWTKDDLFDILRHK